jgi:hypothetical protein
VTILEVEDAASTDNAPRVLEALTDDECALVAILQDVSGLDIAEFLFLNQAPEEYDKPPPVGGFLYGCWRALPHQWGWWRHEGKQQVDQGARDIGKALALDTVVHTVDGPKLMGDLAEGDIVFDETGAETLVVEAHEPLGDRICVEVRFSDGSSITCDADHEWPTDQGANTSRVLIDRLLDEPAIRLAHDDRSIVAAAIVESVPVRCITVAADNRMFLVGETLIPTFNSESILARIFAFSFNMPGEEMALVAPEGKHLDKLTERLEIRVRDSRMMSSTVLRRGGQIATHKPFTMTFQNGSRVFCALPGKKGTGVKGIHTTALEVDEGQDLPEVVWPEMAKTVKMTIPGAYYRVHGVSRGARDTFYDITTNDKDWLVHRITAMHSVLYDGEYTRGSMATTLGGYMSPDYKRNVWGEHGDAMNRIFILARLMLTVDRDDTSEYNQTYVHTTITPDLLRARLEDFEVTIDASDQAQVAAMLDMVQFPTSLLNRDGWFWLMGMDVGLTQDPTELVIAANYQPDEKQRRADKRRTMAGEEGPKTSNELAIPPPGQSLFQVMARITMDEMTAPMQGHVLVHLINLVSPKTFSMDTGGNGWPIFQHLQASLGADRLYVPDTDVPAVPGLWTPEQREKAQKASTLLRGFKFDEKIIIGIDQKKAENLPEGLTPAEVAEKAGIKRRAKDAATDMIRELVDTGRWRMPNDEDFINQMNGATVANSVEPIDDYGYRRQTYGRGVFHLLDAIRFMMLGHFQAPIEQMLLDDEPRRESRFVRVGW